MSDCQRRARAPRQIQEGTATEHGKERACRKRPARVAAPGDVMWFARSYGTSIASSRYGNLYGAGASASGRRERSQYSPRHSSGGRGNSRVPAEGIVD